MQKAQSRARTLLSHKYKEDYRLFYNQEKPLCESIQRAQSRAKTLLVQKYYKEYLLLKEQVIKEGFPRSLRNRTKK